MFLDEIRLKFIQPCTAKGSKIRIKASLSRDISSMFAYMNSHLKSAIYNKNNQSLSFNYDAHIITLYANELNITNLLNETQAYEVMDYVKGIINNVYDNRESIEPCEDMKKLPSPIELYKFLPKLNCKKCGEATCIAFATKLLNGQRKIKSCVHVYEESQESNLNEIENILTLLGFEV